jgi:hypothetical protein
MVLIWGIAEDEPVAMVRAALERKQHPFAFLDQRQIAGTALNLIVDERVSGILQLPGGNMNLDEITSAYVRPYDFRRLPEIENAGTGSAVWNHALYLEDALLCWAELSPSFIVNRPSAMASNNSKPYQSRLIESQGLRTPETLVTTDPEEALCFWERHGTVIYKSLSGVRSIVSRLTPGHRERITEVANCPTQFQQYISGVDVRVHVIGRQVFACEITSDADDYRYAGRCGADVEIHACELDGHIREQCLALSHRLDLPLAGIDLRRTPAGEWYCFEVNPSPGFSFYEHTTGHPISDSVADLLAAGHPQSRLA